MERLYFDFETRSVADLSVVGHDTYVSHPSTQALCMGYAFGDGPVDVWKLGDTFPESVVNHVRAGGELVAHNIRFDAAILELTAGVKAKLSQQICTMAKCAMNNTPQSLNEATKFLGLEHKKMPLSAVMAGKLRRPVTTQPLAWYEKPEAMTALYVYCKYDVEACRALDKALVDLPFDERVVWAMDQEINARGMAIDTDFVQKCIRVAVEYKLGLDDRIREITGGVVSKCSEVQRLLAWVNGFGFAFESLDKHNLTKALAAPVLPDQVREALECRASYAKTSTAKLQAAVDELSADGRLRHQLKYHGAATGRWSGRGAQPQNFPRLDEKLSPGYFDTLNRGVAVEAPLDAISKVLRYVIVAGKDAVLAGGDFSAIEARVLAWLAGQEDVLDVFRGGGDVYLHAASRIYHREITAEDKAERLIGKVCVLALGYQGGEKAFEKFARVYGAKVPEDDVKQIVKDWRAANDKTVEYWRSLEDSAVCACKTPGINFWAGEEGRRVAFRMDGNVLKCRLPSGRVLYYQKAKVGRVFKFGAMKNTVSYWGKQQGRRDWHEVQMYGGKWAENVTQAVARDCLVYVMQCLLEEGYPIVSTVHDEVLCEVERGFDQDKFKRLMVAQPDWAAGLPMGASFWTDTRYTKA